MSAKSWLREAGLEEIRCRTFVADVQAPFDDAARKGLAACFQMLWGKAAQELADRDREDFKRLCLLQSPDFIADRPDYYAFITYSLSCGKVPEKLYPWCAKDSKLK